MMPQISVISYLNLPDKAISCFINYDNKRVYLFYSSNTFNALMLNLKLLREQKHRIAQLNSDRLKIDFRVMEAFDQFRGNDAGYYCLDWWKRHFENQGYVLYKPVKSLNYKTHFEALNVGTATKEELVVRLSLVSGRYKKLHVADYQCYEDAKEVAINNTIEGLIKRATKK